MTTDLGLAIHNDDLGPVVGSFMDTPIYSYDKTKTLLRDASDARIRIGLSSGSSIPAEVLPGEVICEDNIIRRSTTAEAQGYDEFHKIAIEVPKDSRRVTIEEARKLSAEGANILWRPEGTGSNVEQYALVVG
jgi:hypothetical protein